MQSQDIAKTGCAVEETAQASSDVNVSSEEIDTEEEEEKIADDSRYETEEEPTTEADSEDEEDFDKSHQKGLVIAFVQRLWSQAG